MGTDRWWKTPLEHKGKNALWSAFVYNDDVVGVKLQNRGGVEEPLVEVEVFSRNEIQKGIMSPFRSALGANEDIKEFYELARDYPYLKRATTDFYGLKACEEDDYSLFSGILRCLLFRRASHQRGRAMRDALLHHFGEYIAFDQREVIFWPLPSTLVKAVVDSLKDVAKLGFRASYVYSVAEAFTSGKFPHVKTLLQMGEVEAVKQLQKLKGVGSQTAQLCTPHPSFPVAGWNVTLFSKLFFGDESHTQEQVLTFAQDEFSHWQGYAFEYILRDREALKREGFI